MAIKTYYGFDYHLKLCGLIGQVVNYRKMTSIKGSNMWHSLFDITYA